MYLCFVICYRRVNVTVMLCQSFFPAYYMCAKTEENVSQFTEVKIILRCTHSMCCPHCNLASFRGSRSGGRVRVRGGFVARWQTVKAKGSSPQCLSLCHSKQGLRWRTEVRGWGLAGGGGVAMMVGVWGKGGEG